MRIPNDIAKALFLALSAAPLMGMILGATVAYFAVTMNSIYEGGEWYYPFTFVASQGMIMGLVCGLAAGLLFSWPLPRVSLIRVALYLGGGTLAVSVPAACVPGKGVPLALLTAPIGCLLGFALLMMTERLRRTENRAGESRRC